MAKTSQLVIDHWFKEIGKMTQDEMARLWRYAPSGHPIFDSQLPLFEAFQKRFKELGGMTPEVSKRIDWDR